MKLPRGHKGYRLLAEHLERVGHDREDAIRAMWVIHLLRLSGFAFTETGAVYDPQVRELEYYWSEVQPILQSSPGAVDLMEEAIRLWAEGDWNHLRYEMLSLQQVAEKYGDPGPPSPPPSP